MKNVFRVSDLGPEITSLINVTEDKDLPTLSDVTPNMFTHPNNKQVYFIVNLFTDLWSKGILFSYIAHNMWLTKHEIPYLALFNLSNA